MQLPNKITCYNESVISKFPLILSMLEEKEYLLVELFNKVNTRVEDINELIETLDCLYALGRINIDENTGRLYYVK